MFDRDIPIPTGNRVRRWDFSDAGPGCSKAFSSKTEALAFAQAVREYTKTRGTNWGTVKAPDGDGWRVWITARLILPGIPQAIAAVVAAMPPQDYSGTETDDDIALSFDPRRGESVRIVKAPVSNPVEVESEVTPTGRRRRSLGDN
jgi:hypothetical protein